MVFQIQYDAPFKVLDTYLTGLNEGQSNNGKLFNLSSRRPLSYRNQSIDLLRNCGLRKSMDWFLYDNGLRQERVNNIFR